DHLAEQLRRAGLTATLRRQKGEPTVADVDTAVEHARSEGVDVLLGLGGGSAIDAAKAVAGLLNNGGSAVDYMEVIGKGLKITRPAAPWIAIPTTAGTGAEATRNAVIGLPERQFKASIRSELLLPRVALIDPELGIDVPPDVTARSGMDALCQLIESYTSTGAQLVTDALALQGVTLASRSLARAYHDGRDLDARQDMALAAHLSGVTLTNAGLGAVHGFAAPLGANFRAPHGTICAALLPHVIAANFEAMKRSPDGAPGITRYADIGRRLGARADASDEDAASECVRFTAYLARELNIPPLARFGLTEARVPEMVALARKASSMRYNPVILSDEALAAALVAAIRG
ncbi:MAG TPA: iron-containing alcohol dehydrogenase, partial [Tepidisphaeraceae bacterium]